MNIILILYMISLGIFAIGMILFHILAIAFPDKSYGLITVSVLGAIGIVIASIGTILSYF